MNLPSYVEPTFLSYMTDFYIIDFSIAYPHY